MKRINKALIILSLSLLYPLTACRGNVTPSSSSPISTSTSTSGTSKEEETYYSVTWNNYDNTLLEFDEKVLKGDTPSYDGPTPTREGDYVFDGWDKNLGPIYQDTVYTATYKNQARDDNFGYDLNEDETGYVVSIYFSKNQKEEVVVPATFRELPVVALERSLFFQDETLKKVTLPDSITLMGDSCFDGCKALEEVNIPTGAKCIQSYTFSKCEKLTSITIPNTVTSIMSAAFSYCYSLKTVNMSSHLTFLYDYVFQNCEALESITLPDGLLHIGSNAFSGSKALKHINLPDGLVQIGYYTFEDCTSLEELIIPESVKEIGFAIIKGCTSLKKIALPSYDNWSGLMRHITGYGTDFYDTYSTSFDEVTLLDSTPNIVRRDDYRGYKDIKTINLSNNVEFIGMTPFTGCSALTSLDIDVGEKDIYLDNMALAGIDNIENISIKGNVIPCEREIVGYYPISQPLSSLHLNYYGNGGYIGNEDNPYLILLRVDNNPTSFSLHEDCEIIDYGAFTGCSLLEHVTLNEKVRYVSSLIIGSEDTYTEYKGGYYYGSTSNPYKFLVSTDDGLTELEVHEGCLQIMENAIRSTGTLTKVILPEGLTHISAGAFMGCGKLTDITLPDSLRVISSWAFHGCSSLTSIDISDNVYYLGEEAFKDCTKLKSIRLGKSLKQISHRVFIGCTKLETLYWDCIYSNFNDCGGGFWPIDDSPLKNFIVNEGVKEVDFAIIKYPQLEYVSIPKSVTRCNLNSFETVKNVTIEDGLVYVGGESNPYFILVNRADTPQETYHINSQCKYIYWEGDDRHTLEGAKEIYVPKDLKVEFRNNLFGFFDKCAAKFYFEADFDTFIINKQFDLPSIDGIKYINGEYFPG